MVLHTLRANSMQPKRARMQTAKIVRAQDRVSRSTCSNLACCESFWEESFVKKSNSSKPFHRRCPQLFEGRVAQPWASNLEKHQLHSTARRWPWLFYFFVGDDQGWYVVRTLPKSMPKIPRRNFKCHPDRLVLAPGSCSSTPSGFQVRINAIDLLQIKKVA